MAEEKEKKTRVVHRNATSSTKERTRRTNREILAPRKVHDKVECGGWYPTGGHVRESGSPGSAEVQSISTPTRQSQPTEWPVHRSRYSTETTTARNKIHRLGLKRVQRECRLVRIGRRTRVSMLNGQLHPCLLHELHMHEEGEGCDRFLRTGRANMGWVG